MRRIVLLIACFILFTSHELFLKSNSYYLKPDTNSELYLYNGSFNKSENTISRDRIVNAMILGPEYKFSPSPDDYHEQGEVTYLNFKTGNEGTYVAGISTLPREIELSSQEFLEYLKHGGLHEMIAERKEKGLSGKAAREEYSKHVKAILQVSGKKTTHYDIALGYPIEFIPLSNPYELKIGDILAIRLLKDGEELKKQTIHYSLQTQAGEDPLEVKSTKTDKDGLFSITIDKPGIWYVATIHMEESNTPGIDYVSNWATLTFEIRHS
ncbi:MAG: DUF4198 domain-containing protein [Bacteroidota bacterium]